MPAPKTFIGLVGLNSKGKPCGAKFDAKNIEAVKKAGDAMKLSVAIPKSEEAHGMIACLAQGTLLRNGRATVPILNANHQELFDAFIPSEAKSSASISPSDDHIKIDIRDAWKNLERGDIVICAEPVHPKEFGWWPAKILDVAKDGRITVQFVDAPKQKPATYSPRDVALLYPKDA